MKQILIRPSFHDWCQNRLFTEGTSFTAVYREAFSRWKQIAAKAGYKLDTWDMAPLETADILWFLDLPPSRKEFEHICSTLNPKTHIVLQILESPVLGIHAFSDQNTQFFDAVLSYEHSNNLEKRSSYFQYHLPNQLQLPKTNLTYQQRRGLLLLNSNRVEGFWAMRQVGLSGIPGFGKLLSGWHCSIPMLYETLSGELYSQRRELARLAENIAPDYLDIYGRGWNREQVSWFPLHKNIPYRCWRGIPKLSKQDLCEQYRFVLSFENFKGNRGYISEKIFDSLFAGSVPVYLGDEQITDYIPPRAFVDARKFDSFKSLLEFLMHCPVDEWNQMRRNGQEFIQSEVAKRFYADNFIHSAMSVLRKLSI